MMVAELTGKDLQSWAAEYDMAPVRGPSARGGWTSLGQPEVLPNGRETIG